MAEISPYRARTPHAASHTVLPCVAMVVHGGVRLDCHGEKRIAAVLADLDRIPTLHQRGVSHPDECGTCNESYPCETVQAVIRIRRILTGEDPTHA